MVWNTIYLARRLPLPDRDEGESTPVGPLNWSHRAVTHPPSAIRPTRPGRNGRARGRNDDAVPHHTAVDLARNWCALGTRVQLHTAEIPALAPGLVIDHAIPMITETMTGARYLKDRVLGVPAPNSCGNL